MPPGPCSVRCSYLPALRTPNLSESATLETEAYAERSILALTLNSDPLSSSFSCGLRLKQELLSRALLVRAASFRTLVMTWSGPRNLGKVSKHSTALCTILHGRY